VLKADPQTRAIPILLLSARRDMARTANELGVTAYLEKPFDLDDLLNRVQRILDLTEHLRPKTNIPREM
jgi:CheY-like chemotaxis protein